MWWNPCSLELAIDDNYIFPFISQNHPRLLIIQRLNQEALDQETSTCVLPKYMYCPNICAT